MSTQRIDMDRLQELVRLHWIGTVARAFGGKHHTTVISAVQKIIERVKDDASLRSEIHAIESMILR